VHCQCQQDLLVLAVRGKPSEKRCKSVKATLDIPLDLFPSASSVYTWKGYINAIEKCENEWLANRKSQGGYKVKGEVAGVSADQPHAPTRTEHAT